MTYRTRSVVGYIGVAVATLCMIGVLTLTGIAATMPYNPAAFFALTCWTLSLLITGAIAGAFGVMFWPTRFERQHANGGPQRPVDALRALIRRITADRHC